MKWFKHISKSRNDALIRDVITLFGLEGEHVFWRTLEVMADEFDIKKPGFNRFLVKSWSKNYEISTKKTLKILEYFKQKKRIFFVIKGNGKKQEILINCPKLRRLADNWTQKHLKKLRSDDEVNPKSRRPIDTKKKKQETILNNICDFLLCVWNSREIIVHKKINSKMRAAVKKSMSEYDIEDIAIAIVNYSKVLKSASHYFKHKWPLNDFLNRGLSKFIDDADPINNFKSDRGQNVGQSEFFGTCPQCRRPNIDLTEKGICVECSKVAS